MQRSLILFLIISFSCLAQDTFYVATSGDDKNDGSQAQPWETIQYGVDHINAGDTLIVTNGSYPEIVLIQGSNDSGTSTSPITIQAENNVIIDGSTLTPIDRQGLISINDASFIIIDGFELANFSTVTGNNIDDTPVGILVTGNSTNLNIKNNKIHGIRNLSTCGQSNNNCGPGANGIAIYGDTPAEISDLILDNNEVYNCILSSSEAFTINGNVDRFQVINNYVHDNNNIGFDFIGYEEDICAGCTDAQNRARNGYVKGNRAINNSINLAGVINPWYEGDDGSAGGFYVDGGRNIIFDGNYSSQNDMGFEFASEHSGKSSEDILMINNFIYNNHEVGVSIGGYAQSAAGEGGGNAKRINIFNNSFYKNQGWGSEINFSFRVIDFKAANNIFYGVGNVSDNFASEPNGQHANIVWQNNIWWATTNSDTSGIPENTPTVINPEFIDADTGNLNINNNSPAIDVGDIQTDIMTWNSQLWVELFASNTIPVHGVTDINGEVRIENGVLDSGADEYGMTAIDFDLIYNNGFE